MIYEPTTAEIEALANQAEIEKADYEARLGVTLS